MPRCDPRNTTHYWWDRHIGGLSLLQADFTDHDYPPHFHEALVVAATEQGGSIVRSRGQVEEATPSTLFVFNPAEPHAGSMGWSDRWRYRSLYLTREALASLAAELHVESVPYFMRNRFDDPDLVVAFLALHQALVEGRDPFRERELLAASFGALFFRHGDNVEGRLPPRGGDRPDVRRAHERMLDDHASDLRLEDLARDAGVSSFQLIGLFKRTFGLTPHAYLTQVRLNAACRLLRRGVVPADVAAAVGFYDQSALNKHFKRCYGITPRQFARAAAA